MRKICLPVTKKHNLHQVNFLCFVWLSFMPFSRPYVKGDAYSRFHVPFIFYLGETASAVQ